MLTGNEYNPFIASLLRWMQSVLMSRISRKDRRIFSTQIPILKLGVRRSFQVRTLLMVGRQACKPKVGVCVGSNPLADTWSLSSGLRRGNQRCWLDTTSVCATRGEAYGYYSPLLFSWLPCGNLSGIIKTIVTDIFIFYIVQRSATYLRTRDSTDLRDALWDDRSD